MIGALFDRPSLASSVDLLREVIGRVARDGIARVALLGTAAAMAIRAGWPKRAPAVARGLAALATVELSASAALALPISPPEAFLGPDPVSTAVDRVRPDGPFRVRARDPFYTDLDAWRDGVEKTNLGDFFQVRHAAELYRTLYPIFGPDHRWAGHRPDPKLTEAALDRLGVSLLIADRGTPETADRPILASGVRDGEPFTLWGNHGAMPRAYVVPRAKVVSADETLDQLAEVSPRSAVLMETDPLSDVSGDRQPFTTASHDRIDPDRVEIRVTTQAPGLLVVADTWMPGWSATLNGQPAPLFRGDSAFRVVPLPRPGPHEVALSYRAPGLALGGALSAGSLVGIVALIILQKSTHE